MMRSTLALLTELTRTVRIPASIMTLVFFATASIVNAQSAADAPSWTWSEA
ncbi:MAG: hypothetical protein ACJ0SL_05925 [Candidatus Rariloculaceae bacterium]